MAVDDSGDVIIGGYFAGTTYLGGNALTNAGDADVFIAKYSQDVVTSAPASPLRMTLHQNFPNPFNPQTTISSTLADPGPVTLAVYDEEGRRVRVLRDGMVNIAGGVVTWDGRDDRGAPVSSGVYFYRLRVGGRNLARRMVLLK